MNQKILDLQKQIADEEAKIRTCKHSFGNPEYDPYETSVPANYKLEGHGSDVYTVADGYRQVSKDRWKRVCTQCGEIQYSEKTEIIVTSSEQRPIYNDGYR
jgi:hypothetical protein